MAIRSKDPGTRTRTKALRRANQGQRDAYEASLPGGKRPPGPQLAHSVALQAIARHHTTVRRGPTDAARIPR